MLAYSEPLFRPPAEADSIIVQISEGCPYNKCKFCAMYKTKTYRERTLEELKKHLIFLQNTPFFNTRRAFLADGDALFMDTDKLIQYIELIKKEFPSIRQIGSYGSVYSIKRKSVEDLIKLKKLGLRFIYFGIESGDEDILKTMGKYTPIKDIVTECRKVLEAGIKLSVTLIVGLGGKTNWKQNAIKSAELIDHIQPTYTNILNLMTNHTSLIEDEEYDKLSIDDYKKELSLLIKNINCTTVFRSNHASNYYPFSGRLPKDKNVFLNILK